MVKSFRAIGDLSNVLLVRSTLPDRLSLVALRG